MARQIDQSPILDILNAEEAAEKARNELKAKYRITLITNPIGFEVFQDILNDLGVNSELDPNNVAANALRNYAGHLLNKIGAQVVPVMKEE
ncbi:MAG: hypothetical protein WC373_06655 [Smithella sp.]|jgi:hypothetical protein